MHAKKVSPCFILIILLPFALLWRWLFKGEVLYWGTLLFQFWPWRSLVKTALLNGEWPLWNPLLGNGAPLMANLQSAVFYPPNWLCLLLPVEQCLTALTAFHIALAGAGTYWYGRRLALSPFAATIGALTFMWSGYIVGRAQFASMVGAVSWVFIAISLHEVYVRHKNPYIIIGVGVALAMPLLAGHAQLWFYTVVLAGLYAIFRKQAAHHPKSNTAQHSATMFITSIWQRGWPIGAAVIIALLLAAAQLLPTLELMLHSNRATGAERTFALTYSFWPWRLITLLTPNFFGHPAQHNYWGYANYWEDHAYAGLLPLLLSLVAGWHFIRSKFTTRSRHTSPAPYEQVVPFFAALIPVSLILAMGWNTPVYLWVFDNIPGFGYFQGPSRLLIWYTAAIAVLAGVGAQHLLDGPLYRPLWRRLLAGGIAIIIGAGAAHRLAAGRMLTAVDATLELGLWLIVTCTLLLLRPNPASPRQRGLWQAALIGLTAFNLAWYAYPLLPTLPPTIFQQPGQTARFLQNQPGQYRYFIEQTLEQTIKFDHFFRFDSLGPNTPNHWQQLHEWLIPNMGIYARLPAANNDDPLTVALWAQYLDLINSASPSQKIKLLQTMNVGYLLDRPNSNTGPILYQADDVAIRQIPHARPPAYFVTAAEFVPDAGQAVAHLLSPNFDSSQKVIIMEENPALDNSLSPLAHHFDAPTTPVTVQRPHNGRVELSVNAPTAGYVVLTDTFYPGWQATINGRLVAIKQANLAFRAVAVKAGPQKIIFNYQPLSFTLGGWISVTTLIALGGFLLRQKNSWISR